MKQIYYLYTLLIISAVCISSCGESRITQSITLVPDLTEEYFTGFSISGFRKLSCITTNSTNGEYVRIAPITELALNMSFESEMQKEESLLMGNDYERTDVVDAYFVKIDSVLKYFDVEKKTRTESVIFKVLVDELLKLSQSKSDKRVLMVNTDFMEKSFINFYDPKILQDIKHDPEKIAGILLGKYPLPNLTGIEIYFVYLPKDKWDSKRFEVLSGFYKKLFESFGAKVYIVGTI
jgi:hypothetical protein